MIVQRRKFMRRHHGPGTQRARGGRQQAIMGAINDHDAQFLADPDKSHNRSRQRAAHGLHAAA
jgi:hypothetical protein